MQKMRIVFMGTPDFAVPCLEALIEAGYDIPMVITQPDKPVGRKKVLTAPPVKKRALEHGIEVFQPDKVKKDEAVVEKLRAAKADLFVVVAYGKILPQTILDIPRMGCMNVHASLLPKYRGSAPIQWSIVKGESETGVTTMLMDAGMDTGDELLKAAIPIEDSDDAESLSAKLSQLGAKLLLQTIPGYLHGTIRPHPQDHEAATVISMLSKENGEIAWSQPARAIFNQIRGFRPWPGTYTFFQNNTLKIKDARVYDGDPGFAGNPGQVLEILKESILVRTGDGILEVLQVHPANSNAMSAGAFARGKHLQSGDFLGLAPTC